MATMIPMIATTIRSSISVKPFRFRFISFPPCDSLQSIVVPLKTTQKPLYPHALEANGHLSDKKCRIFVGATDRPRRSIRRRSLLHTIRKLREAAVDQDDVVVERRGDAVDRRGLGDAVFSRRHHDVVLVIRRR